MNQQFINETMQKYAELPLQEVVLNTLRQAILTGVLAPGERLMEIQLSNQLGVSRTPVRDAIKNLQVEGFVEVVPRRGAYVGRISEKRLIDVLEVRRALEGLSVSRASRRMSQEQLGLLKEELDNFKSLTERALARERINISDIAAADVRFHDIILESTGNEKLISIMNNLSDQIFRYRLEYLKDRNNYSELNEEHISIYNALKAGDEDGAVFAIQQHIDKQAEYILSTLQD